MRSFLLPFWCSEGLWGYIWQRCPHTCSSSHLPTTSGPSCCLSPSVLLLLLQVSALQQDQALWACFCSLFVTSALLLTLISLNATTFSFSVFWAWQVFEMHSLWKEGKDLVIQSLQSEGKPVPSSEALWQPPGICPLMKCLLLSPVNLTAISQYLCEVMFLLWGKIAGSYSDTLLNRQFSSVS